MNRRKFKLSHSLLGTIALLGVEFSLVRFGIAEPFQILGILLISIIGSAVTIFVATEAIEEVQGKVNMFVMLSVVMLQFIAFFGFQYWFLCLVEPSGFPTLVVEPVNLLLNSVMVFVFNPTNLPATVAGRALLLIDTIASIGLVLFLFQNINEFRRKSLDREG